MHPFAEFFATSTSAQPELGKGRFRCLLLCAAESETQLLAVAEVPTAAKFASYRVT